MPGVAPCMSRERLKREARSWLFFRDVDQSQHNEDGSFALRLYLAEELELKLLLKIKFNGKLL